ncbi:hypothetical protein T492DRAFT_840516 [Pavlovales sp. CCMP2436]|nr:hypothetical protein T492DRAFT_840516 [Pavlovales sp. CCMP2436]
MGRNCEGATANYSHNSAAAAAELRRRIADAARQACAGVGGGNTKKLVQPPPPLHPHTHTHPHPPHPTIPPTTHPLVSTPTPSLGSTGKLRGWKASVFEGGIRVPGLLSWPAGGVGAAATFLGSRVGAAASVSDLSRTAKKDADHFASIVQKSEGRKNERGATSVLRSGT